VTVADAKTLVTALQPRMVERQVAAWLSGPRPGQACGQVLRMPGPHARPFRRLVGTIPGMPHPATPCSPLTGLLSEPTAPALLLRETKWASLVS
jgi:hypothetical protein